MPIFQVLVPALTHILGSVTSAQATLFRLFPRRFPVIPTGAEIANSADMPAFMRRRSTSWGSPTALAAALAHVLILPTETITLFRRLPACSSQVAQRQFLGVYPWSLLMRSSVCLALGL